MSTTLSLTTYVFDTLTTTQSLASRDSTPGLLYQLQYDTSTAEPTLAGGVILNHPLQRSQPYVFNDGRSYRVLQYLVAGASDDDREYLGLSHHHGLANRRSHLGPASHLSKSSLDVDGFRRFETALSQLNFQRREILRVCEMLAAVLHLGQLEFQHSESLGDPDDSSPVAEIIQVRNREVLHLISKFLGIDPHRIETLVVTQAKKILDETITIALDPQGARRNAASLASTLYALTTRYIIEGMNRQTEASDATKMNTISIVDFPGLSHQSFGATLDQLLGNSSAEFMYSLSLHAVKHREALLQAEEIRTAPAEYFDNAGAIKDLFNSRSGLLSLVQQHRRNESTEAQLLTGLRERFGEKEGAVRVGSLVDGLPLKGFLDRKIKTCFTVEHFAGEVEYSVKELVDEGFGDESRFVEALGSSENEFLASLIRQDEPVLLPNPRHSIRHKFSTMSDLSLAGDILLQAHTNQAPSPRRASSFMKPLRKASKLVRSPNTNLYLIFCLNSNDARTPNYFNTPCVRAQVQALGIPEIIQHARSTDFNIALPFARFLALAHSRVGLARGQRESVVSVVKERAWPKNEVLVGSSSVLLSERCWMEIEGLMDGCFSGGHSEARASRMTLSEVVSGSSDSLLSFDPNCKQCRDENHGESASETESSIYDVSINEEHQRKREGTNRQKPKDETTKDPSRRRWLLIVNILTFLVPSFAMHHFGGLKTKDVRSAWREKLAINLIIWLSCAATVVFVMVVPLLICPKQRVYNAKELSSHNGKHGKASWVAIRGEVFDLGAFVPRHYPSYISSKLFEKFAGVDASALFPVQVSALCAGVNGSVSESVTIDGKPFNASEGIDVAAGPEEIYARYHDFRAFTNDSRPDWFAEQMTMLRGRYMKGAVGYSRKSIRKLVKKSHKSVAVLDGRVYDLTDYIDGGRHQYFKAGQTAHRDSNALNFMDQSVLDLFQQKAGDDITKPWSSLLEEPLKNRMQVCLDNLFYIGDVDHRDSMKCRFADWLPLVVSILLCSVIAFKFVASMQLAAKNKPESATSFVICQIPAYTEDEESLRRAIDSVARTRYDDKRKLLVVVCDGLVVGEGNDRSTPSIVLDILGVSEESATPESLSFESLGHGSQRHNMGRVYSGLYEAYGHLVPFLVIVKVGSPSEESRPRAGNRGKRDSQMILMRFLNRVHYNLPMSPMELEIYHHMRNIIGVNPAFYEFMLQIDADTIVAQDSAMRMVSAFMDDMRLIAVCGETGLSNAKATAVTMMQVYEYFISHNLSKAFESLFGCVTCLPGCFSMYRVFSSQTGKPLFVSNSIVEAYATMEIDTLHMKNLLSLGEDRYLTTLLLKHHGKYKMKFLPSARAWTVAPETWAVFLSQRRRWINSTVHNLVELLSISQICGFFFFSMHFVVVVDLITTVVQPVAVAYIVYLVVQLVKNPSTLPIMAIVILAIVYGIQVVAFLIRRKWDMAGWMLIYLAALPIFSLCLPLYSFWCMDDFDWGNTRIVAGEKGKRAVVDEGGGEEVVVPRMHWEDYQYAVFKESGRLRDSQGVVASEGDVS